MFTLFWTLSAAVHGYLRLYMPTNRAIDWLRTPRGLRWGTLVALVATPAYLLAMSVCATIVTRGGPGYLNVLVLLFGWNALKFTVMVPTSLAMLARARIAHRRLLRTAGPCR